MPRFALVALALAALVLPAAGRGRQLSGDQLAALDARVEQFLAKHGGWHEQNVPEADGRALKDIVLKRGCTRALEVGTSTGYSTIWIAWGLAHTGGKLITVEIDGERYRKALRNFEAAGLNAYIDARLGDGHEIVPRLNGPFDFVFIDADKEWYTGYARAVLPMLTAGGALVAHNVSDTASRRSPAGEYYRYVKALADFDTSIVNRDLAVSYKRSGK
jgi:caffeoyl-CoA O-methyltransferase